MSVRASAPADGRGPRYTLVRSARRTLALEIRPGGEVIVRAPAGMPAGEIERLLAEKAALIQKHIQRARERDAARPPEPTEAEREALIRLARETLPPLLQAYAARMGVKPSGFTLTGARTRWGSCSGKNRVSLSWRLMRMPTAFQEYVVAHELAHIRHKNHGPLFYAFLESVMPDYRARRALGR